MDVRIASRVAAGKNRLEDRFARPVGHADGAQIGGIGNIVDRVTTERVTLPDVDRVACHRLAGSPSLHERNLEIERLALGRDRRIADVGAHVASHDAASLEDVGQPAMRIVRSVAGERALGLGRLEKALAPVGGFGDRLRSRGREYRAFAKSRKLADRAHRREQGQGPAAIEQSAEVVLQAEIVIVRRSFASDHRNLCQGRPHAT
jgi:hypothetical protein